MLSSDGMTAPSEANTPVTFQCRANRLKHCVSVTEAGGQLGAVWVVSNPTWVDKGFSGEGFAAGQGLGAGLADSP
jgi:hypothetical protein